MMVRKGLCFDNRKQEQATAVALLNVAGHKQTEFITFLVNDFIRRNRIDINTITPGDLKAAIANQRRLWGAPETFGEIIPASERNPPTGKTRVEEDNDDGIEM